MSFTVCFVQCQQKLQLPHMNMPLFVPDLRKIGCNVECFCLHAASLRLLSELLEGRRVDLLGLEHMAPYSIIRQVKALSPATRIVVGGNGFLDLFSKTEVDFAVAGAGRESIVALVAALREGAALTGVPNLFFKQREDDPMVIRCSERFTGLSLDRELLPYAPELDWTYRGFPGSDSSARTARRAADAGRGSWLPLPSRDARRKRSGHHAGIRPLPADRGRPAPARRPLRPADRRRV